MNFFKKTLWVNLFILIVSTLGVVLGGCPENKPAGGNPGLSESYYIEYRINDQSQKVTYKKNRGNVSIKEIQALQNLILPLGENLDHWNTQSDDKGTTYKVGDKYTKGISITLYAQTRSVQLPSTKNQENKFTVTYKFNQNSETRDKKMGESIDIALFEDIFDKSDIPQGKIFISWNTSENGQNGDEYQPETSYDMDKDLTLFPVFKEGHYIKYYLGQQVKRIAQEGIAVSTIQSIRELSLERPVGMILEEWNTREDGQGTKYKVGDTSSLSLELYAQLVPGNVITYEYTSQGSKGEWEQFKKQGNSLVVLDLLEISSFSNPVGFVLSYWEDKSPQKKIYHSGDLYSEDKDLTLVANIAQGNVIALHYKDLHGIEHIQSLRKKPGELLNLPTLNEQFSSFKPTNSEFSHWTTADWTKQLEGKEGIIYKGGAEYDKDTDLHLYAHPKYKIVYKVLINGNPYKQYVAYRSYGDISRIASYTDTGLPNPSGKLFSHWKVSKKNKNFNPGTLYNKNEDLELSAIWNSVIKIQFFAHGGSNQPAEKLVTAGTFYQLPSLQESGIRAPANHEFTYWTKKENPMIASKRYAPGDAYNIDGSEDFITFYAQWFKGRLITTVDELQAIQNDLSGHYFLMNDINLEDRQGSFQPLGDDPEYLHKGWGAIEVKKFTGLFEGDGRVIHGVKDHNKREWAGLFRAIGGGGIVRNLLIKDVDIETNSYGGGVAGANWGTISSVAVIATNPQDESIKSKYIGGIVGTNLHGGVIENCYTNIGVKTKPRGRAGGIAGNNYGIIKNTYALGPVHFLIAHTWRGSVAGLNSGEFTDGKIKASFFSPTVTVNSGVGKSKDSAVDESRKVTDSELQANIFTDEGWDIKIWKIVDQEWPKLWVMEKWNK